MSEHNRAVDKQRIILEAEQWAKGVSSIHMHGLSTMWYDDRPKDTANGDLVTDTHFNDTRIERKKNGKLIHTFGKALTSDELLRHYGRNKSK